MDLTGTVSNLLPDLHSDSFANLTFWTEAELWGYADSAVAEAARETLMCVERNVSLNTADGTAEYTFPAGHGVLVAAAAGGAGLRQAQSIELEVLHPEWKTWQDTPRRYSLDGLGTTQMRLQPVPLAVAQLELVRSVIPSVSQGSPTVQAPAPLQDYVAWRVLADAWAKQGDAAMPECAEFSRQMATILLSAFTALWGK